MTISAASSHADERAARLRAASVMTHFRRYWSGKLSAPFTAALRQSRHTLTNSEEQCNAMMHDTRWPDSLYRRHARLELRPAARRF